jgi:hypothetical protein
MTRRQEEFRLSCAVADYLARVLPADVLWSHLPFGENRSAITGARLKRMGTKRGWPDYLLMHPGGVLAIELKADKGRPSEQQVEFCNAFHALGHVYRICRSLDDVDAALAAVGIAAKGRAS